MPQDKPTPKVSYTDKKESIWAAYKALRDERLTAISPTTQTTKTATREQESVFASTQSKLAQILEEISRAAKTLEKLEEDIATQKNRWQKDQEDYEKGLREIQSEVEKLRKREEEEYRYQLARSRKIEKDQWEEEKIRREKTLAEKEKDFAARSDDYQELKKRVLAFEQELAKTDKTAREEAIAETKAQAKIERDLFIREVESDKTVAKLKIDSLQQTVKDQTMEIQRLTNRLDTATAQLKQIAVNVIQSASGKPNETRQEEA